MAHYINLVRVPALVVRSGLGMVPRMGLMETDRVGCRVLPWDIDFNLHLNNSRYLSYMDYGRIRLLARLGLLTNFFSRRHTGLVGSVDVTYRRSLNFGVPFTMHTRIACWDAKWIYIEQRFTGRQGLATHAWVKMLFRGPEGNLSPQAIAEAVQPGALSPTVPQRIADWNAAVKQTLHSIEAGHDR